MGETFTVVVTVLGGLVVAIVQLYQANIKTTDKLYDEVLALREENSRLKEQLAFHKDTLRKVKPYIEKAKTLNEKYRKIAKKYYDLCNLHKLI